MSQILIRDLAPETVDILKERARSNRRSLQAEVRVILEEAARRTRRQYDLDELVKIADRIAAEAGPQTTDSVEILRKARNA